MTGKIFAAAFCAVSAAILFCGCGSAKGASGINRELVPESSAAEVTETEITSAEQESAPESSVTAENATAFESAADEEALITAAEIFESLNAGELCGEMDTTAMLGSEMFDSACEKLYGTAVSELTDGGVMFVGAGTLADEVSVLCGGDTAALTALLRQRAARRAEEYGGYAPAEKEKAESALIFEHKGCSVLVISDRAEEIKKSITAM
jgi:hypothetical protein